MFWIRLKFWPLILMAAFAAVSCTSLEKSLESSIHPWQPEKPRKTDARPRHADSCKPASLDTASSAENSGDEDEWMDDEACWETDLPQEKSSPDEKEDLSLTSLGTGFYTEYAKYAKKFGLKLDGTESKDFLTAIAEWIGTPYRYGGCSDRGIDCSCLVQKIYKTAYDIQLPRTSGAMYNNIKKVKNEDLKEGDILCFSMRGRRISHVGIYIKDNKFVHASRSRGVVIDDLNKKYYKKRLVAGGRVIGKKRRNIVAISGSPAH